MVKKSIILSLVIITTMNGSQPSKQATESTAPSKPEAPTGMSRLCAFVAERHLLAKSWRPHGIVGEHTDTMPSPCECCEQCVMMCCAVFCPSQGPKIWHDPAHCPNKKKD